jgi:hypothetical protein
LQPSKLKVAGSNPAGVANKINNLALVSIGKSSRDLLPGRHGEDGNITVQMADDERQGLLVRLREIHSELQKAMGELAQKEYAAAAGVLVSVENLMLDLIGDHGGNVLRHDDL